VTNPLKGTTVTNHRHLQLNVQQTMGAEQIRADVAKAFSLRPDTIVFNEAGPTLHGWLHVHAEALGYDYFIPKGAASQVVLVWNTMKFRDTYRTATFGSGGRKGVSPNRYVVRVRLVARATGRTLSLVGTHATSSGWTGSRVLDAWRQRAWYQLWAVMVGVIRWVYGKTDWVLWSGDMNRPPYTFRNGRPFTALRFKGAATKEVLHTDATHGSIIFDYVGVLSRELAITAKTSTPAFNSDHDGVLADLTLPDAA
jgi:endonuclease/exonuclease/phosphatase (EEP) superfamily protein YafD